MDAKKTGKLIRELRAEKGLTQQELASALHVSQTAVSKWESGKSLPDISLLEPLAASLEVTLPEIILGERTLREEESEMTGKEETTGMTSSEERTEAALRSVIHESIGEHNTRKKRISWFVRIAAAILILVCAWRFWPHSFAGILPAETETMQGVRASLIYTSVEQGNLHVDTYEIDLAREEGMWKDLRAKLESTKYRTDLRNLLIPYLNGVTTKSDGKTVTVNLTWGAETEKTCSIMFTAGKVLSVRSWDGSKESFLLYHPADRKLLDELTLYILKNGEKK